MLRGLGAIGSHVLELQMAHKKARVPCDKQSKSKPKVHTPNWERVHFLHMGLPSITDKTQEKGKSSSSQQAGWGTPKIKYKYLALTNLPHMK